MSISEETPVIVTYVGADGRMLEFAAVTSTGVAYDLTGLTLTLTAKNGATTMINAQSCTVSSAAGGLFNYTPTAAQIATAGEYSAQVKLVNGSGKVDYLERFVISVRAVV